MLELTISQKNIWNLQKYYDKTSVTNICGVMYFKEKLDISLLVKAFNRLLFVQEGLRLRFCEKNGKAVQYVAAYEEIGIPFCNFQTKEEFKAYANRLAKLVFPLTDSAMYRVVLFELSEKSGIIFCASHLISDAWSFALISKSLYKYYQDVCSENSGYSCSSVSNFSDYERISYLDTVQSEQKYFLSKRFQKDKKYWENRYQTVPEPGRIKLSTSSERNISANRYTTQLPLELSRAIDECCREKEMTQAVLFESAIFAYLKRVNEENQNITIGVPVLNRATRHEKETIGMFISTMPLTVSVSLEISILNLCQLITEAHQSIFRHQKYPYSSILQRLRKEYNFEGNLYDVMVSFQNAKTDTDVRTEWFPNGYSEIPFTLHIDNRDSADSYTITIDYWKNLFDEKEMCLLVERFLFMIRQIIENMDITVREIQLLSKKEYDKVLYGFNDTYMEYDKGKCVHELFEEQAQKTPERIALVFEEKEFTYQQLDKMSNALARLLREKGVKSNDIVPIISKRSWHIIVAMLGILKAGGAYMPVDPTYPKDRIEYMLTTAESKLALVFGFNESIGIDTVQLFKFDYNLHCAKLENRNNINDLCYIIFTSGSTGKPKGVALCHRNVMNFCNSNKFNICYKQIKENCSIVSVTNFVFDIFVTESIVPLLSGLTIYFANEEQTFSQKKLSRLLSHNQIEIMQTTPTKMKSYIWDKHNTSYLSGLKVIILAGEAFPPELYEELTQYTKAEIFNAYGPAETTVWSTNKLLKNCDITIGRPMANTQIYILDSNKNLLPIGASGELCISGDGVGTGYLNQPVLTGEKFISNLFANSQNHHGKTMYCTGDLARWHVNGEIEYLGRMDTQVKIRGQRIELGEIESVMSIFDGMKLVAATDKRDENGRQYLMGYYLSENEIDEKALRSYLASKLPQYMIPNYFMRLTKMPMTASGKIDRKNLPVPKVKTSSKEYIAPTTNVEKTLCNVLEQIFDIAKVGITENFFNLGGDSLKAIQYVAEAHNQGIEFALQKVFDFPTVKELCDSIEDSSKKAFIYSVSDFEKIKGILCKNVMDKNFIPKKKSIGNILLTGATGFLGAHILDSFIKNESGKIYCLVRRDGEDDENSRLQKIFSYYFGDIYDKEIGNRIIPIAGDIEQIGLAMDMPYDVQTIIHTAATVKHYGSYEYFYRVNVTGTLHVMEYAKKVNAYFCYISTLSVSGDSLYDQFGYVKSDTMKYFSEKDLYINQDLSNVYVRSKFEAEKLVLENIADGMSGSIMRVGNLTNRYSDGKFQINYQSNAFLMRFKAFLNLHQVPKNVYDLLADLTPVDVCADAIIAILQYRERDYSVFHINKKYKVSDVLHSLNSIHFEMKIVDEQMFGTTLKHYISKHLETKLILNDFAMDGFTLNYEVDTWIQNEFTHKILDKIGFVWNDPDERYYKKYLNYLDSIGYLDS